MFQELGAVLDAFCVAAIGAGLLYYLYYRSIKHNTGNYLQPDIMPV
ncbi:GP5a [Lopma virus]|nr:GP5a [Lopma virus]